VSKDTERVALEVELANVRRSTPFPTAEAIARWNANIARLEAQIAELGPKPEPVQRTWTHGTSTIVRDSSFGTRFERPEELPPEVSRQSNDYDQHLREFGEDMT
jgi:hypothetical protein